MVTDSTGAALRKPLDTSHWTAYQKRASAAKWAREAVRQRALAATQRRRSKELLHAAAESEHYAVRLEADVAQIVAEQEAACNLPS